METTTHEGCKKETFLWRQTLKNEELSTQHGKKKGGRNPENPNTNQETHKDEDNTHVNSNPS